MDDKVINDYIKAGKIWKETIKFSRKKAIEGKSLLELANEIEARILEEGQIAFPVNLSINEEAAHFTPNGKIEDDRFLKKRRCTKN